MSLSAFALGLPKVELHLHLEGSIQPETLLALARRRRVSLPAESVEGVRRWFRFRDFREFVEIYLACSRCLRDPEDFQLLVKDLAREQARQNVLYSEVHFTVGTHLMNGVSGGEVREALWEAALAAEREHGVALRWIPDIVRNVPFKWADRTLDWALDGRLQGVVALGLSGYEESHPAEPFRAHFQEAQRQGLRRVAHAGEHAGPESVRSVLEICGAERIGHGVRSVEDPELVAELAAAGIPLEICPSSNLRLGVVPDLASHPVDRLWRQGVEITVGSDDPPFFDTTLTREYELLAETFGYGPPELAALALSGIRHAFLSEEERSRLEGALWSRAADLGEEHFGAAMAPAPLEEIRAAAPRA